MIGRQIATGTLHPVFRKAFAVGHRSIGRQAGRRIDGVRWHGGPPPGPDETTVHQGVPCTTVARTLVDLAGIQGARSMRRLIELDLDETRLEIDLLWRKERLAIETDGAETHGTASAFRRDRWRDQVLVAAGYRVSRITWDQLEEEPEDVLGRLEKMLAG